MNKLLAIILFVWSMNGFAQVTESPKIKKKSTKDVFITKVEISENQTVFHMYYLAKTAKEAIKDYFEENPEQADELRRMDPFSRSIIMQQMQSQFGGGSISFQASSYIRTSDGKKYKFVSCKGIPKSPDRKDVEPGKKVSFTVNFEKIPQGFELIDLIEYKTDKANNNTFWNFQGIKINNPAKDGSKKNEVFNSEKDEVEEIKEENTEVSISSKELRIFGKIKDANTKETISAKVLSTINGKPVDSLQTSRSGSYEFIFGSNEALEIEVTSPGYGSMVQIINPKVAKGKDIIERDIFLEKMIENKSAVNEVPAKKEPKKEEIKVASIPEIGVKTADKAFELDKVYFNLGDDQILPESHEQLNTLADYLQANPNLKIQIEGHTDNQGDPDLNKKLSLSRAFNVRQYLVSKGINANRILFVGLGATKPLNNNNSEEERKKNRRVEYRIIEAK